MKLLTLLPKVVNEIMNLLKAKDMNKENYCIEEENTRGMIGVVDERKNYVIRV